MENILGFQNTRRGFSSLVITIASGFALYDFFSGRREKDLRQTFVRPEVLTSQNGLLDLTLSASYCSFDISDELAVKTCH
jgi:hypothetical protein